jgi:glycosyltransferase involved in cell wall biosynthesis
MGRLRILLVPDFLSWILGTWAQQIARLGKMHDYYFFPMHMLPYYSNEWKGLLHIVDVVHFLCPYDLEKFAIPADILKINSINHVVHWEELIPYTQADAVMVVAEEWKAFLCEKGVSPERLFLFPNGVDTSKFYPLYDKAAARKQLGIDSTACLTGYSAKFTSNYGGRKGIEVFLDALKNVAATGQTFGVLITGPGWDGAVQQLESYGIEVHYRPFVPHRLMATVYNALDLYVVTSKIEGGPAPLLESMACGVPVVTTPVGLAKEYIQDGVNGLMVPKDNVQDTAQAILRLLGSSELRSKLAHAALETVESHLTWDKTLAGIEQMYEHVWQARASKIKREPSRVTIDPAKQRDWAIHVDSYLWYQQLCFEGHFREGLRGMQESIREAGGQETMMILRKTLFPIMLAALKKRKRQMHGKQYARHH